MGQVYSIFDPAVSFIQRSSISSLSKASIRSRDTNGRVTGDAPP
jgi:hypothetical protein